MRKHDNEESPTERKPGKLGGDAVRTPDRSREGLTLLARMIARQLQQNDSNDKEEPPIDGSPSPEEPLSNRHDGVI